jgi:peptidoglycan/LPS O-acetylase OafA/YrhL
MPAQRSLEPRTEKLIGIELLRFFSALTVIVFHYRHFFFVQYEQAGVTARQLPFFSPLRIMYIWGPYGVHVFWVISGFIMSWKYAAAINERRITASRFAWLRWTRLYPLHFVTLMAVAALQVVYRSQHGFFFVYRWNDLPHFLLNLLTASEWGLAKGFSFNGPFWSVSVEILMYVVFFAATLLLRQSWLRAVLCVGIAFVAARAQLPGDWLWQCFGCFYLGVFALMAYREIEGWKRTPILLKNGIVLLAGIIGTAVAYRILWGVSWLSVGIGAAALVTLAVVNDASLDNPIGHRLAKLGNLTYASYLLHFPLQLALVTALGSRADPALFYSPAVFLGYVIGVMLVSWPVYHWFEMPVQNRLREWARRRATAGRVTA